MAAFFPKAVIFLRSFSISINFLHIAYCILPAWLPFTVHWWPIYPIFIFLDIPRLPFAAFSMLIPPFFCFLYGFILAWMSWNHPCRAWNVHPAVFLIITQHEIIVARLEMSIPRFFCLSRHFFGHNATSICHRVIRDGHYVMHHDHLAFFFIITQMKIIIPQLEIIIPPFFLSSRDLNRLLRHARRQ